VVGNLVFWKSWWEDDPLGLALYSRVLNDLETQLTSVWLEAVAGYGILEKHEVSQFFIGFDNVLMFT